ncbi:MAG: LemA family protein [Bacteroidia bacterium]
MKKWITLGALVLLAIVLYRLFAGTYNNMVTKDEQVSAQWSNVESQYQRRMDLIPNLVNTVKGYADFEKSTLTAVIEARASATQIKVDPKNLTPETMQQYQQAQGQLSVALGRLLAVAESYPELKANQNFLELQAQLEGTENRIAVERNKFNETARDFNVYIRKFPNTLLAGMYGFSNKSYFESDKGSEKAPKVQF